MNRAGEALEKAVIREKMWDHVCHGLIALTLLMLGWKLWAWYELGFRVIGN